MTDNPWIKTLIDSKPLTNERAVIEAKKGIQDYLASSFFADNISEVQQLNDGHPVHYGRIKNTERISYSAAHQALVLAFKAHYVDLDDTHSNIRGHGSAVVLSALLAVADADDEGSKFIEAYISGIEIGGRLGQIFNPRIYELGWHSTNFIGSFAAVAALVKYLDLNEDQANNAFSLVASQAAGFRFQFGTDAKPLQAGIAAKTAIEAVKWTKSGIVASTQFFFGDLGLFHIFDLDSEKAADILNRPWSGSLEIVKPGLWLKAYPFCSAAFRLADAAKNIYSKQAIVFDAIDHVDISFNPGRDAALIYQRPASGFQGKFSGEYVTYLGLTKGQYDQADFEDVSLTGDVDGYLAKFRRVYEPITDKGLSSKICIHFNDGSIIEEEVFNPLGSPENPLSETDQLHKLQTSLNDLELAATIQARIKELDTVRLTMFLQAINGGKS